MRVHLLGVPACRTTAAYELDGFNVRTMLFARLLMRMGHEVILYGAVDNDAPCSAFVSCLTDAEQRGFVGDTPYQVFPYDPGHPLWVTFNTRAAFEIAARKQPHDVICTIAGSGQAQIFEHHPDLEVLEYSIGYKGIAAKAHRIFESQAWRHVVHGYTGVENGRPFDDVIYPWWPIEDFPAVDRPDPYVAFCGRLVTTKGIGIACEAAKAAGVELVVIGFGDPSLVTYGEYVGTLGTDERNRILAHATAVLMPTQYLEPFGNVAAEAQLCGTPVIASDFGAFTESVEHGRSGFRCHTRGEYAQAIRLAGGLDRRYVRQRARALFSEEAAAAAYAAYFARFAELRGDGIHSLAPTLACEPALV